MVRIALVTARRASEKAAEVARKINRVKKWVVDVILAPVDIAALIPRELLERIISEKASSYDLVIVPGTLEYDVKDLSEKLGTPIVKGPQDVSELEVLVEFSERDLERVVSRGELDAGMLLEKWLAELREHHAHGSGVDVCGVKVPLRPPPVVVAAEVYVRRGREGEALDKAVELLDRGAEIVVFGFGMDWDSAGVREFLARARRHHIEYFGVDVASLKLALKAFEEGSCMLLSVGLWNREWLASLPREQTIVVTPVLENLSLPPSPLARLEALQEVVGQAEAKGYTSLVVDPVVDAPGIGSMGLSVASYFMVSREMTDKPLMAGIANVYELVDADSHGQIAVLTQIYAEAGASIMLATEESRKTIMAVTEAAIAATMTSISLLKRRYPKNLGVDLLYVKEKSERKGALSMPRKYADYEASKISSWMLFKPDRLGSHRITVANGVIEDYYIGRRGTVRVTGKRAEEVYKAIAYLGLAREPSHYSYLGYELCKAEHALAMRRSYVQEEPLVTPPWWRSIFYSARAMRVKRAGGGDG